MNVVQRVSKHEISVVLGFSLLNPNLYFGLDVMLLILQLFKVPYSQLVVLDLLLNMEIL